MCEIVKVWGCIVDGAEDIVKDSEECKRRALFKEVSDELKLRISGWALANEKKEGYTVERIVLNCDEGVYVTSSKGVVSGIQAITKNNPGYPLEVVVTKHVSAIGRSYLTVRQVT